MATRDEARTAIEQALLGALWQSADLVARVMPVVDELITDNEALRDKRAMLADHQRERAVIWSERDQAVAALEALQTENAAMRTALEVCLPVVVFVSRGRGYVGCETYPDATARRANFLVGEILFKNTVDARALLGSPPDTL